MRTLSSNSSGRLERKIACSAPPNSTTVASRKRMLPARSAVICTGTRTGLARGKKRANCSAQPCSFAVSVISLDRLTSPLNPPQYSGTKDRACVAVWYTHCRTRAQSPSVKRCTLHAKEVKRERGWKWKKGKDLKFYCDARVAHSSHAETKSSQPPRNFVSISLV